jgi:transposase
MLMAQLVVVKEQILENDRRIRASARETEVGRRLMEIPGVGPLLASAFAASVADPHDLQDRSRSCGVDRPGAQAELERWQGASRRHLACRQPLSAADASCRRDGGDQARRAARHQATVAHSTPRQARDEGRGVALANKTARMVWALMTSGERYREPAAMPA